MKTANAPPVLDQLMAPLGDCLTPESARRLLALKADPELQARVDDLAQRHSRGEYMIDAAIHPVRSRPLVSFVDKVNGTH
jgi:hypothetical protein